MCFQNMFYVVGFFWDKDFCMVMMVLCLCLCDVFIELWGLDIYYVLQICFIFNFVGLFVCGNLVLQQFFVQYWGQLVVDVWEVFGDFVLCKQCIMFEYCVDFVYFYMFCVNVQCSVVLSGEMELFVDDDVCQIVGFQQFDGLMKRDWIC